MNKQPLDTRRPLLAVLLAWALLLPAAQVANAQYAFYPERSPQSQSAAQRHGDGLAFERQGNDKAAFGAFSEAAEDGYPPAQRKLGEIYDAGNDAVKRDFYESIRWYQRARDGGEQIPQPKPRPLGIQ
jgi:TPR repeat protein